MRKIILSVVLIILMTPVVALSEMRYVDRDTDETITGVFVPEQYKGQELLPEDNSEVQAFINRPLVDPDEAKIQDEIIVLDRAEAIQSLKDKGELPIDFVGSVILK